MTSRVSRIVPPLVAAGGLVAGFAVAQATGVRPLGGAVLVVGGLWCGRAWWRTAGPVPTIVSAAVYTGAFVVSHPLAKTMGAWPSVFAMAAVTAGTTYAITSPHRAVTAS